MKYYTFHRESNEFKDILSDPAIKKYFDIKIQWRHYLLIGLPHDIEDSVLGYIVLKYGDDIVQLAAKDYTPKPNIDYMPKKST